MALANGTVALDLALFALGLEPGDEVIVTPRSFIASASTVPMASGVAVFADVDRDSQNITAETIRAKLTPRTKGVIVVHLAGWPCDMPAIMALAREKGLWVIEDCAQAHGAEIDGRPVGSFGDIAAFSFCQDKIITTGGEGGLVAMNDDELWKKAWSRKDHGKSYDAVYHKEHPPGFRWLHESIGTNWRMMSIQAVMGSRQLQRLTEWRSIRAHNAAIIARAAEEIEALRTPLPPLGSARVVQVLYVSSAGAPAARLEPGPDHRRNQRRRRRMLQRQLLGNLPGKGLYGHRHGPGTAIARRARARRDESCLPGRPRARYRGNGEGGACPAGVFSRASIGRPALDAARR